MLEVVEVVPDLLPNVLAGDRIAMLHLRPPRDARPDGVAQTVERYLSDHRRYIPHHLGARADEVHVASQDIPELRQLVQSRPPKPPADPRYPLFIIALPCGVRKSRLRAPHRTELTEEEDLAS